MSKKHKHPEHVNNERWLVSYADFITLLFAFFVVLFSSSQVDRSKTKKMALAIESAFSKFSMFSQTGGELNLISSGSKNGPSNKSVMGEQGSPIYMAPTLLDESDESYELPKGDESLDTKVGLPVSEAEALSRVKGDIKTLIDRRKFPGKVTFISDKRGLVISIREDGIFQSGSNELTPGAKNLLWGMGDILSSIPNQIRVEGHTDNVSAKMGSNWDLSVLRATYVIKWLVEHFGMDPMRFSAAGYGEYKPLASNSTEEGRRKNRRVEIIVLNELASDVRLKNPPLAVEELPSTQREAEHVATSQPADSQPASSQPSTSVENNLPSSQPTADAEPVQTKRSHLPFE